MTWAAATLAWSLLALGGGYAAAETPLRFTPRELSASAEQPGPFGEAAYALPGSRSGGALIDDQTGFALTLRKCLRSVFRALGAYPAIPSRLPPRVVRLEPPRVRDRRPDPALPGKKSLYRPARSHVS